MGEGMLKHWMLRFALVVVFLVNLGCVQFVAVRKTAAFRESVGELQGIAMMPFESADDVDAAALVGRYMTEALAAQGVKVIPSGDVQQAIALAGLSSEPEVAGPFLRKQFGAEGLLFGEVLNFEARQGNAAGAMKSARVAFRVTLHGAEDGKKLLQATFDERQAPASENLFRAARYPAAGSRWLSAEELAQWGASEVAQALVQQR